MKYSDLKKAGEDDMAHTCRLTRFYLGKLLNCTQSMKKSARFYLPAISAALSKSLPYVASL